ncbi:hypothetical protein PFISCL1PPCAC_25739 [Pristionchus fissidentatus]|uniref:Ribosomal protein n=1 Tax=Pristionchus fissidentatus TaxID=1538716 RepID=A0AAV5WTN6_9BILA|nr:hypothetical protein PFISCL1PPCAC_25739 [Pristionchus fissidentatus]
MAVTPAEKPAHWCRQRGHVGTRSIERAPIGKLIPRSDLVRNHRLAHFRQPTSSPQYTQPAGKITSSTAQTMHGPYSFVRMSLSFLASALSSFSRSSSSAFCNRCSSWIYVLLNRRHYSRISDGRSIANGGRLVASDDRLVGAH